MKRTLFFIVLWWVSLSAKAQGEEPTRTLVATYYAKAVEQAPMSLIAKNIVSAAQQVQYKAGKSVLLSTGFEAKTGSVFVADIAYDKLNLTEGRSDRLSVATYPNPFVEKTTIVYQLATASHINLYLSDVEGKVIGRLVDNQFQQAGRYEVEWQTNQLPSGSYICTLEADRQRLSNRVIKK